MADFSYICKHLAGSAPSHGNASGTPACARHLETGACCTAGSPEAAAEGKKACPSAEYIRILAARKKGW
jgi:hypothetical protein